MQLDHHLISQWASTLRLMASYLPVALYAESLRFSTSIISVLGSKGALPTPLTGCIKDFDRIWHLSPSELLSDFSTRRPDIVSLRHGNVFPAANPAILDRAGITGRRAFLNKDDELENSPRPTFIYISYIVPLAQENLSSPWMHGLLSRMLALVELIILGCLSFFCFRVGLHVGAVLLLCIASNLLVLLCLQHTSSFVFANQQVLDKDKRLTTRHGAALDAHVIVENFNASDVNVVIGYSSQVHALTNLPVKVRGWTQVVIFSRLLVLVMTLQGAILAASLGQNSSQSWGPAIWLICYAVLHLLSTLVSWKQPIKALGDKIKVIRAPALGFSGRKTALAFISTLPGIERRPGVGEWDWIDRFMPKNDRRKDWTCKFSTADQKCLLEESHEFCHLSEDVRRMLRQVYAARRNSSFKVSNDEFLAAVCWDTKGIVS